MASTDTLPDTSTTDTRAADLDLLSILLPCASSLADITYTSSDGLPVSDLLSSAYVHFPSHSDTPVPRGTLTRAVRSRNSPAFQPDSLLTPSDPAGNDEFLPLDALIFLLQTKDEAVGLYAVKATRERVARVDTLDRPNLLDFLLGRKAEKDCEVILSKAEADAREARRTQIGSVGDGASSADGQTTATATEATTSADVISATPAAVASSSATATSSTVHPLLAGGKRPYVPSKQDAAFVKRLRAAEVVLRDRAWAFRCQKPSTTSAQDADDEDDNEVISQRSNGTNGSTSAAAAGAAPSSKEVDFTSLRRSMQGRIADVKKGGTGGSAPAAQSSRSTSTSTSAASTTTPTSNLGRSQRHRRLDPIIILPSSPSSLLTLSNIKAFLEEGKYIPPSSASTLAPTGGSNEVVVINRPKGGRFLAVDSLDALNRLGASRDGTSNDPWRRVACIVTTGQKWQFKGYRWEEGRELFRNVFGVYPRYTNQPKDANVRDWNVTELAIEPSKRHHDQQLCAHFWRQLEGWIARRKPELV